ncbi:hypothetical protein M569_12803, partial [Genlisea aurea]
DIQTSSCVDESDCFQTTKNLHRINSNPGFVKDHKSGMLGRSLDISKFSGYRELRNGLAKKFGLEGGGLSEDPQRSGWQLVFADREDDILLLSE